MFTNKIIPAGVLVFALSVSALTSGCGLTASPAVESRPDVSRFPTLGVRFASDEAVQPAFPPAAKPGTHWSRNWGWYAALAGVLATDFATDGEILGLFEGDDDGHHVDFTEFTEEGAVATARDGSSIKIEDVETCDFNFVAEGASEISCSALVPDDEE